MIPAPPTPCRTRPVSMTMKLWATPQTTEPAAKKRIEGTNISRRPKMSDRVAMKGWRTAWARRYEVPVQKATAAVPLRSRAKVGRTGTRMVASRATLLRC